MCDSNRKISQRLWAWNGLGITGLDTSVLLTVSPDSRESSQGHGLFRHNSVSKPGSPKTTQ